MVECPACKKQVKDKGLSIHMRLHCPKRVTAEENPKKVSKRLPALKCDCGVGKGAWALLAGSPYAQATNVINPDTNKPYVKYCTVCREAL